MKERFIIIPVLILILGGAIYYFGQPKLKESPPLNTEQTTTFNSTTTPSEGASIKKKIEPTQLDLKAAPQDWKVYSYQDFKIALPAEPKITTGANTDPRIPETTYLALGKDNAAYFLTVSVLPKDILIYDSRELLGNTVMAAVKNLNGELAGAMDTRNSTGLDSIDFVISISDGPRTYMGRNVLNGNTLYEMRVVYLDSKWQTSEFRGFVDSLKLQ